MFREILWRAALLLLGAAAGGGRSAATAADAPARPKYGPAAVRLFQAREFVRRHEAPDFWALAPYYAAQPNAQSCSAASVAMVVNALRAARELRADEQLATPASVVEVVEPRLWKDKLAPGGPGVTLDELASVLKRVLPAYGVAAARVEVLRFDDPAAEGGRRLREVLTENERSSRDFLLVNFLQSAATGDPEGAVGHIAPVAAYDAEQRRVLLLDPDRQWYEPYWVFEDALRAGIATQDPVSGQPRGVVRVVIAPPFPDPQRP